MGSTSIFSNPGTTYSQLMIAAHKTESENEEAHDKVSSTSVMTKEPVEGSTEPDWGTRLPNIWPPSQGQDRATAQPAPQIAPDRETVGGDRWTGALLAVPAPITVKLVWDRLPEPTAHLLAMS